MKQIRNTNILGGLDSILTKIIQATFSESLEEFLEHRILPLLGNYCRGDPLQLYSTEEVAKLLGVSIKTVRRYKNQGTLKHIRLGSGTKAPLRFRRVDIETFLNKF